MRERLVLDLGEVDRTRIDTVGGKAAHLGELSHVAGANVPPGFCVTTAAHARVLDAAGVGARIERMSRLRPDDRAAIATASADVRRRIEATPVPDDVASAIADALERIGPQQAYAVRSSATAEDLPTASFAGQQDSYLNVIGLPEIRAHVVRCWASLFTERAVAYRLRDGIDHRTARMAVVVQRMIPARAAGVLFTADPVSGHRRIASIEATLGLGEALVAGKVDADVYTVRDDVLVARRIGTKRLAMHASPTGGVEERAVVGSPRTAPVLTDDEAVRLVALGRRIEAHLGAPQDIEWCLTDDGFAIVQSRPITTLFPIPVAADDANHVYVSIGHQQMMTDAMKPLGISVRQLTTPMAEAAGRLFVDVTAGLAAPASRASLLDVLGRADPLIRDALQTVLDRGDFIPTLPDDAPPAMSAAAALASGPPPVIDADPAIVAQLIARCEASVATLERELAARSGSALFEFIRGDLATSRHVLFDAQSLQVVMAGMEAARWLNQSMAAWLGERNAADTLVQSVPHNVTSEMGLALLDVADVIRPHADVVAFLERGVDDDYLAALPALDGGAAARDAIERWLERYGMRGVGEIDITRPRWRERPSMLVPLLLTNVRSFEPGAAARRFAAGEAEARAKADDLLARLRTLPDGERKAAETQRMIDQLRTFAGYREYPKYDMMRRTFAHKRALLAEAERLVRDGVLHAVDDAFYLTFDELHDAVRSHRVDDRLIEKRRAAFRSYRSLVPPRVLTSDGERLEGSYRRDDVPAGALIGMGASAGTVEGRARIVHDLADATTEPGDILVTTFTDPSWTPLFVSIAALVTEVGGRMTHGAVVAREYGLPAVVGVDGATRLIRHGQRIRVHGAEGYVELMDA